MKKITSLVLVVFCVSVLFQQSVNTTYASEVTDQEVTTAQSSTVVDSVYGEDVEVT